MSPNKFVWLMVVIAAVGFVAVTAGTIILLARAPDIQLAACEPTEAWEDFDMSTTLVTTRLDDSSPPLTEFNFDIEISGDDFYIIDSEGMAEIVGVDGVIYNRQGDGVWQRSESSIPLAFGIEALHYWIDNRPYLTQFESKHLLCVEEPVTEMGIETLDGVRVKHVQVKTVLGPEFSTGHDPPIATADAPLFGYDPEFLAAIPDTDATWDYWIGSDGIIVKTVQVFEQSDIPEEKWNNDGEWRDEYTTTISGVGEPNVITAPNANTP